MGVTGRCVMEGEGAKEVIECRDGRSAAYPQLLHVGVSDEAAIQSDVDIAAVSVAVKFDTLRFVCALAVVIVDGSGVEGGAVVVPVVDLIAVMHGVVS